MQPRGLILEGVTGAGNSSTLTALTRCAERSPWLQAARLISEEETLGWSEGMITYLGSEARALEALVTSRIRRLECCAWTRLPTLILDTSAMDYGETARQIAAFCAD